MENKEGDRLIIIQGKIKGKARPRVTKQGIAFTPKDTIEYENWVRINYKEQCGRYFNSSVRANITAYYKVPKSYPKKRVQAIRGGQEHPQKKPDADNIAKIILDSLNKIAYEDDSQVTELKVLKRWTEDMERVELDLQEVRREEKKL